jgi:hypothetical protein
VPAPGGPGAAARDVSELLARPPAVENLAGVQKPLEALDRSLSDRQ